MEDFKTLNDLFEAELKDTYSAEQQIMEAMPKMIEAASSSKLRDKFTKHMQETETQIKRLESIFKMLDMEPEAEKCEGMAGILKDGEKTLKAKGDSIVKDAALVIAAQKVEHYEITTYGSLRALAMVMGKEDIAKKLTTTLKEESKTDEMLTTLAESAFNSQAPQE